MTSVTVGESCTPYIWYNMSRRVLKFAVVCLICIGVITLLVLLLEGLSN